MRRILLIAALLGGMLLPQPGFAQLREGQYGVEGNNPDGSAYTGQLRLQALPNGAWYVVWQVGDSQLAGVGVIRSGVLAIGFAQQGRPGVIAYEVEADGKLHGFWTTGDGIGTEVLTPQEG